jgi:hypothetical protein
METEHNHETQLIAQLGEYLPYRFETKLEKSLKEELTQKDVGSRR